MILLNRHVISPVLTKQYPKAVSAKGVYVYDEHGNSYLDASSGAITCSLGHSHPKMIEKLTEQLNKLQFVYRSQFVSDEAEQLAHKLFEKSSDETYKHAFFVNSGTEAIETAMKMALQYFEELGQPKKTFFLSRRISYHGITMGALSLSGHPLRRKRFESMLEKYPVLHASLETDSLIVHEEELVRVIETIGSEYIAALVLEPIVGAAGGAIIPPEKYYIRMKEICKQYNILFIADEVLTGIGRTGTWFALDHFHATADIVAVGKSLGAGYAPIAAALCTSDVLAPIKKGTGVIMSGHTYSAHPLSCQAALSVLSIIEEENLLRRVNKVGEVLHKELLLFKQLFPFITHARQKGLLIGIEMDGQINKIQEKVIATAQRNGLLLYPSAGGPFGKDDNALLVAPPFIISDDEVHVLVNKLAKTLKEVADEVVKE